MSAMLQGAGGVDADAKEAVGLVDAAQTLRLSFRVSRGRRLGFFSFC